MDDARFRYLAAKGHAEVRVPIPRRENPLEDPDRGLLIVSYAMHRTKVRRNDSRRQL